MYAGQDVVLVIASLLNVEDDTGGDERIRHETVHGIEDVQLSRTPWGIDMQIPGISDWHTESVCQPYSGCTVLYVCGLQVESA